MLRDNEVWSYKALNNAAIKDSEKEVDFYAQLCDDLTRDMREVNAHFVENSKRHGKEDNKHKVLERKVFDISE